ncbi:MAG: FAD-dependent oxidoreductase [Hydrogenophaga sp.]|uniref:FAD-dependent oxidoreductase n=1 Tax=Hydrogenophaga sp. TaxID=1904254 RepID=UPI0025C3E5F5|nr:FAD-dependent oxidoreductase [Hydrogenophaga sp.]MBT9549696.1 FAD-dependent oxidoreductase [Hydrogenophaga sp.]
MQVLNTPSKLPTEATFDLVVIGAGGAGMAAALFAALKGQRVLLVERTEHVGGTTAWSAGTTWVPGTHHAASVNPFDTLADAARYLNNAIGERTPPALRQAFLDHGAATIRLLEDRTELKFRPYAKHPDYISDLGGSTLNGRALEPLPFDGRLLGDLFPLVRPPIPEFTVLGGMMVDRTDINHLLALTKSFASFRHALRIIARHGMDRLRHPRGTRLVMGNALVARLLYSLSKHAHVTLLLNTSVKRFERSADGVSGVVLEGQGKGQSGWRAVTATGGVVLASGGFNRHPDLRAQMLPGAQIGWCPAAPGHTAEAHALAKDAGAVYGKGALSNAFWAPVSLRQRADGSTAVFPHFVMDRAKPGMLTVNQAGERFVNESTSYHLFGMAMQASGSVPAFLVCDAQALQTYGLGMVRPGASAKDRAPFLADGYLTQGATLDELADRLGIDAASLKASVQQINAYAETGVDPDFQRGATAYQQNIGDAAAGGKNPNLGPLDTAPFYALKLYPGDIGAATGFATDGDARVLDAAGQPIAGLYAVGNDMHSIMGGVYTAPGITIGPGIVFGFLAARHAAARAQGKPGL